MKNIWLDIDLSDYENHMALPSVAQSKYLSQYFSKLLQSFQPRTVALLGCSGGNGLEMIDNKKVKKVICVDINPNFLREAENRFSKKFNDIEFVCQDITSHSFNIYKVDLVYGGLVFEYTDITFAIANISKYINEKGILGVVLQHQDENIPEVSPSKYKRLEKLSRIFRFVSPIRFTELCNIYNLKLISEKEVRLESGKKFSELIYQRL